MNCLVRSSLLSARLSLHRIDQRRIALNSTWFGVNLSRLIPITFRPFSSDTDFKPSEELAKERYDSRINEDIEKKRARLLYQSRKRGMLENGVILASFADKYLSTFDADHLDQYDRLINLPTNDWDIYYWATNTKPTPEEFETPVLGMLRKHLKSKVSNEQSISRSESVLGKKSLDDVVLPAVRRNYQLDIDVSEVDLTNYKKELFDDRTKSFSSGKSIQMMTDWRKKVFERRLKRTVSSPTSLKTLDKNHEDKIYTQSAEKNELSPVPEQSQDLIDSVYERAMKHHDFMQYLLGSELTNDPLEYDDEVEAWAEMFWHRQYGTHGNYFHPTRRYNCTSCQTLLQSIDPGLSGYVPKEVFFSINRDEDLHRDNIHCQRCKFRMATNAELSHQMSPNNYVDFLNKLSADKRSLIVVLIDLTDFPASIWEGLVDILDGDNKNFLIVGNKLDLLPFDGYGFLERINRSFRRNLDRLRPGNRNLRISDTIVLSARTGFGVEGLVTRIHSLLQEELRNVYLIGSENSGKSTLFSALLQSDLSAIRKGDLVSRISSYSLPGSKVNLLRFPIDSIEGWQAESRKRRTERVERDSVIRVHALSVLSQRRQDSMPHIATLINRLDYDLTGSGTALTLTQPEARNITTGNKLPKFSDDHPLAKLDLGEPMSATKDKFQHNVFFHQTPSSCHPDHLYNLLTNEEKLVVFPNETIVPRKFSLRPLDSLFIAGLARLDLLTSRSNVIFTIFASRYLPIHVVKSRKADKFYHQFLGSTYLDVPFGDEVRFSTWPDLECSKEDYHILGSKENLGTVDIVLSSFGWAMINLHEDHECVVRAFTPGGKGIFIRDPPLLSKVHRFSLGRKIRDTPVFMNQNYQTREARFE